MNLHQEISTKTFYSSLFVSFLLSLGALLGTYFYLNQPIFIENTKANVLGYLPVTKHSGELTLNINSPENELLTFERSLMISGKSSPNTVVMISVNNQVSGFEVDSKGHFNKTITLASGLNVIQVTAADMSGKQAVENRLVYYSEEKL